MRGMIAVCDYCRGSIRQSLLKNTKQYIDIRVDSGNSVIVINYFGTGENHYDGFRINYCPMCGRKLS